MLPINPNVQPQDGDFFRYNADNHWLDPVPAVEVGNVRMQSSGEEGQIMVRGDDGHLVNPSNQMIPDLSKRFLPFAAYAALSPMSSKAYPYAVTIDRPVTLLKLGMSIYVKASNNAENYWTIRLKTVAGIVIATCNTASLAPDAWHQAIITEFGLASVNAAHRGLCIECVKTGDAGLLNLPAPLLEILPG